MRKLTLLALALIPVSLPAQTPDEYGITVHVISSHWLLTASPFNTGQAVQKLDVLINGKKYELETSASVDSKQTPVPGDYKAKLVQDEHKTAAQVARPRSG